MNKIISNDEMWKKQVSQDNIEKYTYAIKLMEKHTELERLKYKYETLKSSNKMLDEDLRINDLDNNPKEKEQETLSSIKDIRRTVMAKEPNLKAMPENFSEQTKLAKSLLERGV